MRRFIWPVIVLFALAALVGFVALELPDRGGSDEMSSGGGSVSADAGAPEPAYEMDGSKGGALGVTGEIGASMGPSVIRYGDLSVVVEVGSFDRAYAEAGAVANRYGGFVISSSVSGGDRQSGYLTIRVDASDFDRAMADLRDLGDLERESVSASDVTPQLVDIEARLTAWKAQRDVLLGLMRQARTVADTLKVQVELQNVQMNIEQIEAEQNYLQDQVDLSTITVSIREPGAEEGLDDSPGIGDAFSLALEAFVKVIVAMIVGLGYVIPIGIVLAALAWVWRTIRRRRR